jgi:hypothetical protein
MRASGVVLLLALLALPACSHECVPKELMKRRDLIDLCATETPPLLPPDVTREIAEEFQHRATTHHPPGARPYRMLALSGGGLFGAYGVGVLSGWTESGSRPVFDAVTGVSTGALMATFAFLGPEYDAFLRDSMVGIEPREVLRQLPVFAIPRLGSLYSPAPLTRRVQEAITSQVLKDVAREYRAGRRLYIGTTALDARRLVVWDMGAIAARGNEEALTLFRAVILASSAVPGALPPVQIPVEIDGHAYQEIHVDGGVSDKVFFRAFMVGALNQVAGVPGTWAPPGSTLYVINNDRLYAEPSCVRGLFSALSAAVGDIYSNKSRDELFRIYLNCLQTGLAFRVTAVPQDISVGRDALRLAVEDQQKLYEAGRRAGQAGPDGSGWRATPPGLEMDEQLLPRAGTHFATPCAAVRP